MDEADLGGAVVTTIHRIERLDSDRVVYRTEITGPGAADIGPAITGEFPETIAALIASAGR